MRDFIRVDLHCHSSLSDGDHSPAYVAQQLAEADVVWAALADHNTISGLDQFRMAAEERGIGCIPGLEVDARSPYGPLHVLAYGFDPQNRDLLDMLRAVRQPSRASARRWLERLRVSAGRPVGSLIRCSPANGRFPSTRPPGTGDAIRLIHEAGGRAFLAHPLAGLRTIDRLKEVLNMLQSQGLDGLEVFHKPYSDSVQRDLLALAELRGLLTVAGSDFHGFHHHDGASPGVDMPLEHWERFVAALGPERLGASSCVRDGFVAPDKRNGH